MRRFSPSTGPCWWMEPKYCDGRTVSGWNMGGPPSSFSFLNSLMTMTDLSPTYALDVRGCFRIRPEAKARQNPGRRWADRRCGGPRSDRERHAAPAGALDVRVVQLEPRLHQRLAVI